MSSLPINESRDPEWIISFGSYSPDDERRREALLATGNGIIVTRGASTNAVADQLHYPGTYLAGYYERICSVIDGEKEETESLVNLPNWLPLWWRINEEDWFTLDKNTLLEYRHSLDMQTGISCREYVTEDSEQRRTRVSERRLGSMLHPGVMALRLELTPLNWSGKIAVRSGIDGGIVNSNVLRYQDYESEHFEITGCEAPGPGLLEMRVRTRRCGDDIALSTRTAVFPGQDEQWNGRWSTRRNSKAISIQSSCPVTKGTCLTIEKQANLIPAVTCCDSTIMESAPDGSRGHDSGYFENGSGDGGYAQLESGQAEAWRSLWQRSTIETGHRRTTQALRFHSFHLLQTLSPLSTELDTGVPARGWHGEDYRGHIFWDAFCIFPFLNCRFPDIARARLLYRYRRLDAARGAARDAGFRGAMYPWRSAASGDEVTPRHQKNILSGRWMPDTTHLQRHVNAAIVFDIWQYYLSTGDHDFLRNYGAEVILEIARFWSSIADYVPETGRFEIHGVVGPDEYHMSHPDSSEPGLDNNAYTNVMAVWSLMRALDVLEHIPPETRRSLTERLGLGRDDFDLWERISRRMRVVFQHVEASGQTTAGRIISQFEGFENLRQFDRGLLPDNLAGGRIDWALEAMGRNADEYQVIKQADTLTLFYLLPQREICRLFARLGYEFGGEDLLRTAEYYLSRTEHRSSLSRIVYAGALAHADPARSWRYYQQALGTDLDPHSGSGTSEGIHLGAMGGTIDVLQRHYLGLIPTVHGLRLEPRIPHELGTIRLELVYRGIKLAISGSSRGGLWIKSAMENTGALALHCGRDEKLLKPGGEFVVSSDARAQAVAR